MSYVDFVNPAIKHAQQAADADENKKYEEAYKLYLKSIEYFMTAIKHEKNNPKKKEMLKNKVNELFDRAEQIKAYLDSTKDNPDEEGGVGTKKKSKKKDSDKDNEKKELQTALESAIVREKPSVKWIDVAGLDNAKEALKEAVILPIEYPQLFIGKREPWRAILLYGPPGTGKSYLATAVASEANSTFISVSAADLVSKWQGESEKLVKTLFEMAQKDAPAVIFIDEVDSLCGSRSEGENDAMRRIKTQFMIQMQGVGKNNQGVFVLAATNLPWALDPAIRRRFDRRVYIPLPDIRARHKLFELCIGDTPNDLTRDDLVELSKRTDGYSGSDISVLVRNALMEPVRTCQLATHFKRVRGQDPHNPSEIRDDLLTPCSPSDPRAQPMSLIQVPRELLLPPKVSKKDFLKSLKTTKPSVSQNDLHRYVEWTQEYGQEG